MFTPSIPSETKMLVSPKQPFTTFPAVPLEGSASSNGVKEMNLPNENKYP
jgi:hypothetical protein